MNKQCPSCGGNCGRTKQTGCQYKDIAKYQSLLSDEEILKLARQHLDKGLCFDMKARITRSTDAELLAFALAIESKVRQQDEEMRKDSERINWLINNPTWTVRARIHTKKRILQWQMLDDGENCGQWGEYREVLDASIAKQKGEPNG